MGGACEPGRRARAVSRAVAMSSPASKRSSNSAAFIDRHLVSRERCAGVIPLRQVALRNPCAVNRVTARPAGRFRLASDKSAAPKWQLSGGEPHYALGHKPTIRIRSKERRRVTMAKILPESLESQTIARMTTGRTAYTVAWAMWVDTNRNCWLHPTYDVQSAPFGNFRMRIELREDGYHVWAPPGETWSPQSQPGYAASGDVEYLPVAELHEDGD